jgi:hypothetical protein
LRLPSGLAISSIGEKATTIGMEMNIKGICTSGVELVPFDFAGQIEYSTIHHVGLQQS